MVRNRIWTYLIALLLCKCLFPVSTSAQKQKKPINPFHSIDSLAECGLLPEKYYLDSVRAVFLKMTMDGICIPTKELKTMLIPLYNRGFEGQQDMESQVLYYQILGNNATMCNRDGEALYYYDKFVNIRQKDRSSTLKMLTKQISYYALNEMHNEAQHSFRKNEALFNAVTKEFLSGKVPKENDVYLFHLINFVANSFCHTNDSLAADSLYQTSQKLKQVFFKHIDPNSTAAASIMFLTETIPYYIASQIEKDRKKEALIIQQIESDIKSNKNFPPAYVNIIFDNINYLKTNLFIETRQFDSAMIYITKTTDTSAIYDPAKTAMLEHLALVFENDGNLGAANHYLRKALELQNSLLKSRKEELDNLWYAYSEADETKSNLIVAEKKNKVRAILILLISFIGLSIVAVIVFLMKRKEKEAQNRIEQINFQAAIQIAAMEESKNELQQKIGKDIHDSLASLIASIKNRVELLTAETDPTKLEKPLLAISSSLQDAYDRARKKSHLLVNDSLTKSNTDFSKRIKAFADFSLPESQFEKEILIDEGVSDLLNTETKIEMIKVMQEAITNIVKHAKASKVAILAYEENDTIFFSISDNGKGFRTEKSRHNFGLNSIRERVRSFGGILEIKSTEEGTSLSLKIPTN